jgi:hypothetical protein
MTITHSDPQSIDGKKVHVTLTQKHKSNEGTAKFLNWKVATTGGNDIKLSVTGESGFTVKVVRRDGKTLANIGVDETV